MHVKAIPAKVPQRKPYFYTNKTQGKFIGRNSAKYIFDSKLTSKVDIPYKSSRSKKIGDN